MSVQKKLWRKGKRHLNERGVFHLEKLIYFSLQQAGLLVGSILHMYRLHLKKLLFRVYEAWQAGGAVAHIHVRRCEW